MARVEGRRLWREGLANCDVQDTTIIFDTNPDINTEPALVGMSLSLAALTLVLVGGNAESTGSCKSEQDCGYLGACMPDGDCRCDAGWTGTVTRI